MAIDVSRHYKIFNPAVFGDQEVHIIGCGAVGSRIALSVAKLGITNLHLWDFDTVESHNIANQAFGLGDVGLPKVTALKRMLEAQTGCVAIEHNCEVTPETALSGVVFLVVDSMQARRDIFEGAIRYRPNVLFMVETRMDQFEARVFSIRPCESDDVDFWERQWYPDERVTESLCGSKVSIGPTAEIVSGCASLNLMTWFLWRNSTETDPRKRARLPLRGLLFAGSPHICAMEMK